MSATGISFDTNKLAVSFHDPEFDTKALQILLDYGTLVVNDVFEPKRCDEMMERLLNVFKTLSPNHVDYTFDETGTSLKWPKQHRPPETRAGMNQRLMGNTAVPWELRTSHELHRINSVLYSGLRGKRVDEFVTSIDGINVKPPIAPFAEPGKPDWAHLDQTHGDPHKSIQGQCVISDSRGAFRVSPKSHMLHKWIMELHPQAKRNNFMKIRPEVEAKIRAKIEELGGAWQIPIRTPKGSCIFWFSSTIHSAILPDEHFDPTLYPSLNPKWANWRGVVYICQRPMEEASPEHLKTLQEAFHENRCTNHWGEEKFPDRPFYIGGFKPEEFAPEIRELVDEPWKMFERHPELKVEMTPEISQMIGMSPESPKSPSKKKSPKGEKNKKNRLQNKY